MKNKKTKIVEIAALFIISVLACISVVSCSTTEDNSHDFTKTTETTSHPFVSIENTSQQISEAKSTSMEEDEYLKIIGDVEETKDRLEVYSISKEFTKAYFQDDIETIKKYLVTDYQWSIDVYSDYTYGHTYTAEDAIIYGIKGLSDLNAQSNDKCLVQVEFLPSESESRTYLCMQFEKHTDKWLIYFYGLEK